MAENQPQTISRIIDADIVSQYFGGWPAFHDAEIVKVTLEVLPTYRAAATFVLAAAQYNGQVDERGYYQQVKLCRIELQFVGIKELEIDYFGHQNVLFDLLFEEKGADIQCTFNSSVGLDALVVAEEVAVLSLTPTK